MTWYCSEWSGTRGRVTELIPLKLFLPSSSADNVTTHVSWMHWLSDALNLVLRVFVPLNQRSENIMTAGQGERRLWDRDWDDEHLHCCPSSECFRYRWKSVLSPFGSITDHFGRTGRDLKKIQGSIPNIKKECQYPASLLDKEFFYRTDPEQARSNHDYHDINALT